MLRILISTTVVISISSASPPSVSLWDYSPLCVFFHHTSHEVFHVLFFFAEKRLSFMIVSLIFTPTERSTLSNDKFSFRTSWLSFLRVFLPLSHVLSLSLWSRSWFPFIHPFRSSPSLRALPPLLSHCCLFANSLPRLLLRIVYRAASTS